MWCAYDPGISVTGEITGTRDFGVSSLYASKFDGVPTGADSWESSNVRILPGTRVEVRIRVRGKKHSFNSAVWFQGNIRGVQWSTYGEVDLLEIRLPMRIRMALGRLSTGMIYPLHPVISINRLQDS